MNTPRRLPGRLRPSAPPAPAPTPPAPPGTERCPARADQPEHPQQADPIVSETAPPLDNSDSSPSAPILYTPEQAAAMLQVRPSWLRRRAAARAVPCRLLGKHLRFAKQDIEQIAAASLHTARIPAATVTRYGKTPRRA
ncbi:MAG: helix-turn-helix domain-containing protein [Saccharothrix sp.]|nr:helix-turn-helix domain-containing protein [Saccharothrix sp.]